MQHKAVDINFPIGCGVAPVFPGDLFVGDNEGVIVIPAELAGEVADEAAEMTDFEEFVAEQVLSGETIIGLYLATKEENLHRFEKWRKERHK